MNPYEVLGIDDDADQAAVKKAYKSHAQKLHPDRNPDDEQAAEKFDHLKSAYDILKDPEKRAQWDKEGSIKKGDITTLMRATMVATEAITNLMQAHQFVTMDYITPAKKMVVKNIGQFKAQKGQTNIMRERVKTLMKASKGEVLLAPMESMMINFDSMDTDMDRKIDAGVLALELLDECEYLGINQLPDLVTSGQRRISGKRFFEFGDD